jgi:hypothetical protein
VAGTGIGAASGLITLLVGRRFDARDRRDDRAWAIRQQNIDQRREIYGDLLGAGHEVWFRSRAVSWSMAVDLVSSSEAEARADLQLARVKSLRRALPEYRAVVAKVEVAAVDHGVVRLSRKIERLARDVMSIGAVADDDAIVHLASEIKKMVRELRTTLRDLVASCRRDLGFEDVADTEDDREAEETALRYDE